MDSPVLTENQEKLKSLMLEVLLLTEEEFSFELKRSECQTWDSLAVVALAAGVEETFGYHLKPDEAIGLTSVADIVRVLESKGIRFHA
jgi:acyl carrier protein